MATTGAGSGRILQVHPTQLCNLSCAHCYSSSSPKARRGLRPDHVALAIDDAARLGYRVVSLSGGEPLAYDGLEEVVGAAKQAGCQVNLVSNGILIHGSRFERVQDSLGVVALSLDGLPDRHNAIRRSATSFERVCSAAYLLRQRRQPFGLIHTLTSESLDEIEALAAIASDWGASLLQLHPFEPSGRGAHAPGLTPLSPDERVIAYILAAALTHEYPHMRVQADLVHRDVARCAPAALHGAPLDECATPRELVLQDDGRVVPLTYGLDPAWAIVDVTRGRLADALPGYLAGAWPQLRRRTRAAAIAVARGRHGEVVAWHEVLRGFAETRRVMALAAVSA
jgi:MoaA/NifB/PqqE/SkfB family radical SAM enzyme